MMREIPRLIASVGLLLTLTGAAARGQEPKPETPSGGVAASPAPTSEPADDIDPATVDTIKADIPDDFVTHTGAGGGFTIRTPPSWKEAPRRQQQVVMLLQADTGTSLNVVVVPAPPGERMKAAMDALPAQLAKSFKGFKLVKADYVLYCGRPTGRLIYDVSGPLGKSIRIMQIYLIRAGRDYVVTFTAPADQYDAAYKKAEPAIASFDLADAPPSSQPAQQAPAHE